jgi:hypothetical protein
MATRGAIAYKEGDGWIGIYQHWDSYPRHLGKEIWRVLHEKFIGQRGRPGVQNSGDVKNALKSFIEIYIKGHPSGWSIFDEECFCHSPEFVMRDGVSESKITSKENDPLFIEYVYIIAPEDEAMYILANKSISDKSGKVLKEPVALPEKANEWGNAFNYGHCAYRHELIAKIDLRPEALEPDWEKIENREFDAEKSKDVGEETAELDAE